MARSSIGSAALPVRARVTESLDWPLSQEEKKTCLVCFYENDVLLANSMLEEKERVNQALREENKALRRQSLVSTRSSRSSSSEDDGFQGEDDVGNFGVEESAVPASSANRQREAGSSEATVPREATLCDIEAPQASTLGATGSAEASPVHVDEHSDVPRLGLALLRFLELRKVDNDKRKTVAPRLAQHHVDQDTVPELWAWLATKYEIAPTAAVHWLGSTLGRLTPVQWPRDKVPASAARALEWVSSAAPGDQAPTDALWAKALGNALRDGEPEAIAALAFRGCPDIALRPPLWRALLGLPPYDVSSSHASSESISSAARPSDVTPRRAATLEESRNAYREIRADIANRCRGDSDGIRAQIEADARACWRGEVFVKRSDVMQAVISVTFAATCRIRRYVLGSCDVAALLIYALSAEGTGAMEDAECDAYWCLLRLLGKGAKASAGGSALGFGTACSSAFDDADTDARRRRLNLLLSAYDPALVELLALHGLHTMPATRLGSTLCARAGFTLADCVVIWDSLLADPRCLEFCDYVVVALLILNRGRLAKVRADAGELAEALLECPRSVEVPALMRVSFAVCAFERRCDVHSQFPFPARPGVLDVIASSAVDSISSLFTKVVGAGTPRKPARAGGGAAFFPWTRT